MTCVPPPWLKHFYHDQDSGVAFPGNAPWVASLHNGLPWSPSKHPPSCTSSPDLNIWHENQVFFEAFA
ncbi:hypothetical protein HPP92_014269 [Vanilla planifolia]|uniref:Uncharacterized protein n=1 Tax=Vanilla planifolia TaxID=51239 RepID=A0A835QN03_VANPL|nr:hypothetical protein HPP92_014681 [Vanilla planifolia]KAG0474583.1 hypothetical protein HPP92_014269 [Vanilla planifolia]